MDFDFNYNSIPTRVRKVVISTKETTDNDDELPKIYLKIDFENKKLKESIKILKKQIPKLFDEETTDEENLNYLIKEVFIEDYPNTFYFTNASFFNEKRNKDTIRLYLRPQKRKFLLERMPDNLTLSFRGYIKEGLFVINEIFITREHNGKKDSELEIKVIPYHTPKYKRQRIDYKITANRFFRFTTY